MTSTLQQDAGRKLRFSASRTMRAAQRLYENGYITYMRTDSTTLSDAALTAARNTILNKYGASYLPPAPRTYKKKVKNAQEAHEAIRPAGDNWKDPDEVAKLVGYDEGKIYELVWKRTLASQMEDAKGLRVQLRIDTEVDNEKLVFGATGNTITFPGFLRAYVEGSDDPDAELDSRERILPPMNEGDAVAAKTFEPQGHETQPPPRYTEASLVRHLEELGVGRPSTYASIIKTIIDRGYTWKKGNALVPSFKAFAVVSLLEKHFEGLVDYAFTARMEDELDLIAQGTKEAVPWLHSFYFGKEGTESTNGARPGLRALVSSQLEEIDARQINTLPLGKDSEGRDVVVRVGKYGPYLQRDDQRANIAEDMPPDELDLTTAIELLDKPSGDRLLGVDPETSLEVHIKEGRFGAYVQLGDVVDGEEKPKTQSLLKSMSPESLTFEDALKLLSLPRIVGEDGEGVSITATNGRYGPYITRGSDRRSLENEDQIFTVDVAGALHLLSQPRQRRRRAAPAPLRELGKDPTSGGLITLREGRFGPYVTDGETNASLRTGDSPDSLTPERAHELLQLRRERGPVKKKKKKKKVAKKKKKVAKKKTAKKKTAKKKTAKKKTAKKKTAKKATSKKVASKKATKKAASKKAASKKATKKTAAKKAASKKAATKKTGAKKPDATKAASKKKTNKAAEEAASTAAAKKSATTSDAPAPL